MTKFEDGPAAGKVLELGRIPMPYFLRVTKDQDGTIDALDQLDDEPKDSETLFVYYKSKDIVTVHVDGRDKKGKRFGKWYNACEFKLWPDQPSQDILRDADEWRNWCRANAPKGTVDPVTGEKKE